MIIFWLGDFCIPRGHDLVGFKVHELKYYVYSKIIFWFTTEHLDPKGIFFIHRLKYQLTKSIQFKWNLGHK